MKIGDKIKTKIPYGHFKKGHKGTVEQFVFHGRSIKGTTLVYDLGIFLEGDISLSGWNHEEVEVQP